MEYILLNVTISFSFRFRRQWKEKFYYTQTLNIEGHYTKMGVTGWKTDVNKNLEIEEKITLAIIVMRLTMYEVKT